MSRNGKNLLVGSGTSSDSVERGASVRARVNNYTHLECGSNKGEPIVGAGGAPVAAMSG